MTDINKWINGKNDYVTTVNYKPLLQDNMYYYNGYPSICPSIRQYHLDMLFNQLIDHCYTEKLYDRNSNLLINRSHRMNFYKFCFANK
ncbi:MAG: hypothetical protein Faunusvirus52_4 [Faunusvirus sp.]|jgi:hypothetical protein|uniref:Uncharacterized protein n=1 Tax=Faunusvirus sp. TaxID=2487766 RepID=A0A3G4ZXZ0_9VIRU|nr:MAG: hypothetical protein Faunusvirus52_4 [Faunusvirus sp.]